MKRSSIFLYVFLLFNTLLLPFTKDVKAQGKVNITAGIGTTDLLNLGFRFQFQQSQIGVSMGTLPSKNGGFSVSSSYHYHFGGSSNLSKLRPWYGKTGLVFLKTETETFTDSYLFIDFRIGREVNFSTKMSIAIDAGPAIQLIHTTTDSAGGWSFPVFPALGLTFFYRI